MTAKRPNSYFEELVKIIGLPSTNSSISVTKLHLFPALYNTVKRKLLHLFQKVTESADIPPQPHEENTEESGMCKAFKVIRFLYVFCLLNHKDNSGI